MDDQALLVAVVAVLDAVALGDSLEGACDDEGISVDEFREALADLEDDDAVLSGD